MRQHHLDSLLAGVVLVGMLCALAVPDPVYTPPYTSRHALQASQKPQDARIADTDPDVVCREDGLPGSAYSRQHRIVPRRGTPEYQLDHTVPLCLGGADVDANIQLQPLAEAHVKDRLEAFACRAVCREHSIPLSKAQEWFTGDWKRQLWKIGQ